MRRALSLVLGLALAAPAAAQTLEKELVATISGPAIERAVVSELLWDGGMLIKRKENGARWDISIVRVPERFRR